jgi:DNA mismatch endonuclease (patch repair protein)
MHPRDVAGIPDFAFKAAGLAVFVDGCFWHGCPNCRRTLPATNRAYWLAKIRRNIERAKEIEAAVSARGILVLRIWEHDLKKPGSAASVAALVADRIQRHRPRVTVGPKMFQPNRT